MKKPLREEKGFTLFELLIVVGILGILAVVIVPNVDGFLMTVKIHAANTEVANVKGGAKGYYAENAAWPASSNDLCTGNPDTDYLSEAPKSTYTFDIYGLIAAAPADGWATEGLTFVVENQEWIRSETPVP